MSYDAWGQAWGTPSAWGISWVHGTPTPPTPQQPSGGYYEPKRKRRTKEDIRADRIRFGVLQEPEAVEAVQEVAKTVIEARDTELALKEQEQAVLLKNLLTERGIILEAPGLTTLLKTVIREEVERQDREDFAIVQLLNEL